MGWREDGVKKATSSLPAAQQDIWYSQLGFSLFREGCSLSSTGQRGDVEIIMGISFIGKSQLQFSFSLSLLQGTLCNNRES